MKRLSYFLVVVLVLAFSLQPVMGQSFTEKLAGYKVGATGSFGFINGAFLTNSPVGASVVIGTPFGYNVSGFDLNFSGALGFYSAEKGGGTSFTPFVFGVGANLTLLEFVFAEGHLGLVGSGPGVRGFAGVSLERIMNQSLNLPVNILVGGEGFISSKPSADQDNASYWGGLGVRVDYNF
ncbi:MAG: hypothetical protein ACE5D7_11425 [Fidelibacterota bacterium]